MWVKKPSTSSDLHRGIQKEWNEHTPIWESACSSSLSFFWHALMIPLLNLNFTFKQFGSCTTVYLNMLNVCKVHTYHAHTNTTAGHSTCKEYFDKENLHGLLPAAYFSLIWWKSLKLKFREGEGGTKKLEYITHGDVWFKDSKRVNYCLCE